jgi:type I restriction enzyme S subunit
MYRNKSLLVQLNLFFSDLTQKFGSLKFKDAFDLSGGYAFKSTEYKDTGLFVLRVTNISEDGTIDKKDAKFIAPLNDEDYKEYQLRFGDVLIVMIGGSIGKVGFVDQESLPAFLNQNMWLVRSSKGYSPKYIFYLCLYLCHYHATEKNTSYGFYSRKNFKELIVPDISCQDSFAVGSIIDKIANQETIDLSGIFSTRTIQKITSIQVNSNNINCLKSELDKQEKYISQLKEAILQEAIAGQLTAEWHTQNPMQKGNPDTDAIALLAKIKAEKQRLIADGKLKKEKPLAEIAIDEVPFSIPDNWIWTNFGEVILDIEAGKSPDSLSHPAELDKWGVIKMSAISWDVFLEEENKQLKENMPPFKDKEIKKDDFIMTRANTSELVAKSVIVGDVRDKLLLNDKTLRVRFPEFLSKKYFHNFNNGAFARSYYASVAKGSSPSMKNVTRDNIKSLLVPLPPLAEQKAIVEKVDRLMNIIDQLEQQIKHRKQLAENLMQTVLREAFE